MINFDEYTNENKKEHNFNINTKANASKIAYSTCTSKSR